MANEAVIGTSYLVRTATGVANAFETLVCLTTNGWQASGDEIDTSSKCTGGWASSIAGRKGWTITGEGQAIAGTTDTGTASFDKMFALWKAGTTFNVEMYNTDPDLEDDIIRGPVRITALEKTAPDNAVTTFNVTFTGQGEPFIGPTP